ncbi:MAG: hypothetical protein QMD78_07475, partial [Methanocellales archaeon]|nr:hypothetical protein [Methanocellales archaeon]
RAKMDFKFREGFSLAKLRIPRRIFEVPTPHGFLKEEEMRKAIEIYGRIIGREVFDGMFKSASIKSKRWKSGIRRS